MTIAPGKSIRPDFNGVKPNASCINKGSNVSAPIKDTSTIIVIVIANVNILNLKTLNSNIGTSSTSCLQINKPIIKIPALIDPSTIALVHPFSDATLKPYKNAPNSTYHMMLYKRSNFGFRKSVKFLRYKKAIIIVIATIGNIVKNKACQSKCTSSHPDKVGPMAGPNAITIP